VRCGMVTLTHEPLHQQFPPLHSEMAAAPSRPSACPLHDLPRIHLPCICHYLWSADALHAALASPGCFSALRRGGLWRFGCVHIDGERRHNASGIFGAIETEGLVVLSVSSLGAAFFRELGRWPLGRLEALRCTDCPFGDACGNASMQATVRLLAESGLQELAIHRGFLSGADVDVLRAALAEERPPAARPLGAGRWWSVDGGGGSSSSSSPFPSPSSSSSSSLRRLSISEVGLSVLLSEPIGRLVRSSALHHLALKGRFVIDASFVAAVGDHGTLRTLQIGDNPLLRDDIVRLLCDHWSRCVADVALTSLDFSTPTGGSLTDLSAIAIGAVLPQGVDISDLRLVGHRMTTFGLHACLAEGCCLRCIDFAGNNLCDVGNDSNLAAALATVPLRELHIGGGRETFDDDGPMKGLLSSIAWVAGALPHLRVLDASRANLDDDAVARLADTMSAVGHVTLWDLDLSENFITEVGVLALLSGLLRGRARLRRLDLAVNHIGCEGCTAVGDALKPGGALSSITDLSLQANAIAKVSAICAALASSELRALDLRGNLLSDPEVQQLAEACAVARPPLEIRLAENDVSEGLSAQLGLSSTICLRRVADDAKIRVFARTTCSVLDPWDDASSRLPRSPCVSEGGEEAADNVEALASHTIPGPRGQDRDSGEWELLYLPEPMSETAAAPIAGPHRAVDNEAGASVSGDCTIPVSNGIGGSVTANRGDVELVVDGSTTIPTTTKEDVDATPSPAGHGVTWGLKSEFSMPSERCPNPSSSSRVDQEKEMEGPDWIMTRDEWQDCLDSLEWVKSCLK